MRLLVSVLSVGSATAIVTWTLTMSKLFRWPRGWLGKRSDPLDNLVHCPYCMSHWVALGLVLVRGEDFWVWGMAMVVAQICMGLIRRSYDD